MAKFEPIEDKGNPGEGTGLFYHVNQKAIEHLERLTAKDKAFTVPYLRMWQVDPRTGRPAFPDIPNSPNQPKRPITLQAIEPPAFGSPTDLSFRERPVFSIDRLSIKSEAFKGRYSIQTMNLRIVIHRPDAIGVPPDDVDDFSSLIVPGNVHAVEYGWSSAPITNPLFNGEGINEHPVLIPARKTLYFTITNYNFGMSADRQIKVDIVAHESGMLNLRKFIVGTKSATVNPTDAKEFQYATPDREAQKNFYATDQGKAIISKTMKAVQDLRKNLVKGNVLLKDLLNGVFADTIAEAFKESGYKNVKLRYGYCNKRAGKTSKKFGSADMGDKPIGDFPIPMETVIKVMTNNFKAGLAMTVQNFMTPFVNMLNQVSNWTNEAKARKSDGAPNQTTPDVFIKVVPNGDSIGLFLLDAKREFAGVTPDDMNKHFLGPNATPERIREELGKLGIPIISFLKANSYIRECEFQVIGDDKVKAHLIQQYLGKDARVEGNKPSVADKKKSVDARNLLYSAAIQGNITTLGNFAFELFGLVWLEFGVNRWDGPFNVRAHEDVISRGVFETKFHLISAGQDPLGTQGRRKLVPDDNPLVAAFHDRLGK